MKGDLLFMILLGSDSIFFISFVQIRRSLSKQTKVWTTEWVSIASFSGVSCYATPDAFSTNYCFPMQNWTKLCKDQKFVRYIFFSLVDDYEHFGQNYVNCDINSYLKQRLDSSSWGSFSRSLSSCTATFDSSCVKSKKNFS